jgi:Protein of unknown function (DUF2852)
VSNAIVLEDIPRPLWLVMMILGFIFFWPVGLAVLAYLFWSGKMRCGNGENWKSWKSRSGFGDFTGSGRSFGGSTGNRVFDDYREQTLRKLEEDAREFRSFVERLRQAKDKDEFDRFMAQRGSAAGAGTQSTF